MTLTTFLSGTNWETQLALLKGLFVVPTPIGHREDISIRALVTLQTVDGVLCEDTRETIRLLRSYGITTPCYSYHQHNEHAKMPWIFKRLETGHRLALVSDRGSPGIADAGLLLISSCYERSFPVHVLPGPCSVINAFLLSGFLDTRFFFQGFLPRSTNAQIQKLEELKTINACLIFFESPARIVETLQTMLTVLGDKPCCVMKEMTKKFEHVERGLLSEIYMKVQEQEPLGEYVISVHQHEKKRKKHVNRYAQMTNKEKTQSFDQDCDT